MIVRSTLVNDHEARRYEIKTPPMQDSSLYELDYLVFSSHKTATQSTLASLRASGFKALHCHTLYNIDIEVGRFAEYLDRYKDHNNKKLKIISIFREPVERLISSFFQWHGIGAVRHNLGGEVEKSLIYQLSGKVLEAEFHRYCQTIDGFGESLDLIGAELEIKVGELDFSSEKMLGDVELGNCQIFLIRFDQFVENFESLLGNVSGSQINSVQLNIGEQYWYGDKYRKFKKELKLPSEVISEIFQSRRHLIEMFYPGGFDSLLASVTNRYCK